ncbi:MAG: hypothetical protein UT32_C0010G0006 [Parcubacteria group bacterium GW2011_GWC2_39_14]|nr:MAG: hypothetical protein UT32_C0010G0006 [Parcubacteria group bacterium GW2011_GWC2_39_14]KKR55167.1 MAG: hypothetical protein UT91_C0004G0066 [Parcubacteria group bacterium GW2011_GWA2_40_23]
MEQSLILNFQKKELTGYKLYLKLARQAKTAERRDALEKIATDEQKHHDFWASLSKTKVVANNWETFWVLFLSHILGLSFAIKSMENEERRSQHLYKEYAKDNTEIEKIIKEEQEHEKKLMHLLKETKIHFIGAIVLSLNDSLVELTGALAGFTLAFQQTNLIALAGLVTGFSATFSLAASEYLSQKAEQKSRTALRSGIYTGITYIITAVILTLPFFIFTNPYLALGATILLAILIIFLFNYYISVVKEVPFKRKFWEMVILSLSVALISFIIGYIIREVLGVSV